MYKEAKNQVKRLHLRAYFEILISNVTMRRSIDKKSVREILANILAKIFHFFKNIKANKVRVDFDLSKIFGIGVCTFILIQ